MNFNQSINTPIVSVPMFVVCDKDLTPLALKTFCVLSGLSNAKGYCYPTNTYLATVIDASKESISRAISELANKGYVKRVLCRHANNPNVLKRFLYVKLSLPEENSFDFDGEKYLIIDEKGVDENINTPMTKSSRGVDENIKEDIYEYLYNNNINAPTKKNYQIEEQNSQAKEKEILSINEKKENNTPLIAPPPPKKKKREIQVAVPSMEEFVDFVKELDDVKPNYQELKGYIEKKYLCWKENGWKDGHDKQIKNWRSKCIQVFQKVYLPIVKKDFNSQPEPMSKRRLIR